MKFLTFKNVLILVSVLLIFAAGAFAYYLVKQNLPAGSDKDIAGKVAKLIDLPAETPTMAAIDDLSKLQDQPFYAKAQLGDILLVYAIAQKAILYRPSTNKIINIAPVNLPSPTPNPNPNTIPTASPLPSPLSSTRLALYNGTLTAGLTTTIENNLKSKNYNVNVVLQANAIDIYEKTLVVDISGTKSDIANQLAEELQGIVGDLPANEATASATPDKADILIYLGNSTPK
ncbi:hypothetical protein COT44_05005 [Candidatus Shapirobacteria bacterium CG08_land_8_20_14_0_20_39_18]|uniref:LytR/CpsA/Psr regulator C-terminal domain-containing protein n=1 Tax=Candidatus Shapirobacteria bacterium CG08_land_8_20_14_0_20_39_18 TaxID=1974883 RepID=A0A2M6XBQ0_9BACT|nr:MAG: hypothetical protein COT44_05005 [Candidatus Shapirobacteria bacterium CG08_land_8_20_14_0_20_39_18]PJE68454.1 MAG: hypothetical protein COU94_01795 [Candidatus Shapirobacteria bacterium CG10_big_fil_rev_8_21_14_0_10_38_8]